MLKPLYASRSVILDSTFQVEVSEADDDGIVRIEVFRNRTSVLLFHGECSDIQALAILLLQAARGFGC